MHLRARRRLRNSDRLRYFGYYHEEWADAVTRCVGSDGGTTTQRQKLLTVAGVSAQLANLHRHEKDGRESNGYKLTSNAKGGTIPGDRWERLQVLIDVRAADGSPKVSGNSASGPARSMTSIAGMRKDIKENRVSLLTQNR